jgi:MSHA biogenesis protein MshN
MSLINQMLNELENRGANVPLGEDAIRAVPPHKQSRTRRYAIPVALVLVSLSAAAWYFGHTDKPVADKPVMSKPIALAAPVSRMVPEPVSAPDSAVSVAVSAVAAESATPPPEDHLHGKPLLLVDDDAQVAAAEEPKKTHRHRPEHAEKRIAEADGNLPLDPEDAGQLKTITPRQRAENAFSKANQAAQEGRTNDALAAYKEALLSDPTDKDARGAWIGLLLRLKRNDEAESVLRKGLQHDPHDASFAMLLARLQVDGGDVQLALQTLQKTLPYALGQPEYQAFIAALLQRQNRHEEAVAHYQSALKMEPNSGIWLMGMGISLQALQRNDEARAAYRRSLATNSLNAQLQAFVQNRLRQL